MPRSPEHRRPFSLSVSSFAVAYLFLPIFEQAVGGWAGFCAEDVVIFSTGEWLFRSEGPLGTIFLGLYPVSLVYSIFRTPYGDWKHRNEVRKDSRQ